MKKTFSEKQVEHLLSLYNDGYSLNQISSIVNRAFGTVAENLRKHPLYKGRSQSEAQRKYKINDNYFDKIDTEEKAYFLGFLFADGNVSDGGTISLSQAEQDKEIIYKLASVLGENLHISSHQDKRENRQKSYSIAIISRHMAASLKKLGCVPRKTFILKFPKIRRKFIKHFIRGYFDGDGCISISLSKRKSLVKNNVFYTAKIYDFNILSTLEMIESIKNIIYNNTEVKCGVTKRHKNRDNNNFTLRVNGRKQVFKILSWLYSNSSIYLTRKYNKFCELSNCGK